MIHYSWKKITKYAGLSSKRIVAAFISHVYKPMPRSRYDVFFKLNEKEFSGDSYMVAPHTLLSDREVSHKEIADYIGLASFRNYAEYLVTNDASLDILHSPLSEDKIKQNRLLSIRDGRIHFKYEEVTKGD